MDTLDNRNTEEAERVREGSEFLRHVEDFARYTQKEYVDDGDGRALLVCAGDRSLSGGGTGGAVHVLLGDRAVATQVLASMMQQDCFAEVMKTARLEAAGDGGGDMDEAIAGKRRRLRFDYCVAGFLAAWTLFLAAMGITGVMHWALALTNLALMGVTWLNVWREIAPLRRQLKRLEAARREADEAFVRRGLEAMASFACGLEQLLKRGDEDDDD